MLFAGRAGLVQDRALAHERYGEHWLRMAADAEALALQSAVGRGGGGGGTTTTTTTLLSAAASAGADAEHHLREAIRLYEEWGAHGKARRLRERHGAVLGSSQMIQVELPKPAD